MIQCLQILISIDLALCSIMAVKIKENHVMDVFRQECIRKRDKLLTSINICQRNGQ